jgi:hypothetical protein
VRRRGEASRDDRPGVVAEVRAQRNVPVDRHALQVMVAPVLKERRGRALQVMGWSCI